MLIYISKWWYNGYAFWVILNWFFRVRKSKPPLLGECVNITIILIQFSLFFALLLLILIWWIISFIFWRIIVLQFFISFLHICIIINNNFLYRGRLRLIKYDMHGLFSNQCYFIIHSISFAYIWISKKNTNIQFWIRFASIFFCI